MIVKRCARCKLEKPTAEFYANRRWRDGLYPYCKPCFLAYCKQRREARLAISPGRYRWKRDLVRHDYFEKLERPIQAYVLGFLAADGNVLAAHHRVTIELAKADEHLWELVRDELVPGGAITRRCRDGRQFVILAFVSRQMIADLAVYGITPAKSRTLRWPTALAEGLTRAFVLGYFDGDGFVTSDNRVNGRYPYLGIVSGSREFLESVATAIRDGCGATMGGPWRNRTSNAYTLRASGLRARAIDDWLHQDGMGLTRKRIAALMRAAT